MSDMSDSSIVHKASACFGPGKMYFSELIAYSIVAIIIASNGYVRWSAVDAKGMDFIVRCDDITDALIYLYENLPAQMALIDKCKRYAMMASYLKPMGRLHNKAVSQVLRMPEEKVDQIYEEFVANKQLSALYMTAIDGFRAASILEPPLLELVDCLKQINDSFSQAYLDEEELRIILTLYQRILESPETKIDLSIIPSVHKFRHGFVVSLANLFKDNILHDSIIYRDLERRGVAPSSGTASSPYQPRKEADNVSDRRGTAVAFSERMKKRREQRRRLAKHRHREQDTLRARRLRILSPSLARDKARTRLERRRKAERERILRPCALPPVQHAPSGFTSVYKERKLPPDYPVRFVVPDPETPSPREGHSSHLAPLNMDVENPTCDFLKVSESQEDIYFGATNPVQQMYQSTESENLWRAFAATPEVGSIDDSEELNVDDYLIFDQEPEDENKGDNDGC